MEKMLLDLLLRKCQIRFTQSMDRESTKCWVWLEGEGDIAASEWLSGPDIALSQAHNRAMLKLYIP